MGPWTLRSRRAPPANRAIPLETRRKGAHLVLRCLLRAVDSRSATGLLAAARAVDLRGVRTLRFDLGGVARADTALVAVLVLLRRFLGTARVRLAVGPVSPAAAAILSLHDRSRLAVPACA